MPISHHAPMLLEAEQYPMENETLVSRRYWSFVLNERVREHIEEIVSFLRAIYPRPLLGANKKKETTPKGYLL